MKKLNLFLAMLLLNFTIATSQKVFESEIKRISNEMEVIISKEQTWLKNKVDETNELMASNKLSTEEAENIKKEAAIQSAQRLEKELAPLEMQLSQLVKDKAEGNVTMERNVEEKNDSDSDEKAFNFTYKPKKTKKVIKGESRTTSQGVFAIGLNSVLIEGDINSLNDSDFSLNNSRFYEWGFTNKTRMFKHHNLLHLKYGLSLMYNNLRPNEDKIFEKSGKQTNLVSDDRSFNKDPYFRNMQLVLPMYLEFDFTKKRTNQKGDVIFKTQKSVRAGVGGYGGLNMRTKQILNYTANGNRVSEVTKGDFNTNRFIYGVGAYLGYEDMSLYVKYDLNPLFSDNVIAMNNISLGVRFDFN